MTTNYVYFSGRHHNFPWGSVSQSTPPNYKRQTDTVPGPSSSFVATLNFVLYWARVHTWSSSDSDPRDLISRPHVYVDTIAVTVNIPTISGRPPQHRQRVCGVQQRRDTSNCNISRGDPMMTWACRCPCWIFGARSRTVLDEICQHGATDPVGMIIIMVGSSHKSFVSSSKHSQNPIPFHFECT